MIRRIPLPETECPKKGNPGGPPFVKNKRKMRLEKGADRGPLPDFSIPSEDEFRLLFPESARPESATFQNHQRPVKRTHLTMFSRSDSCCQAFMGLSVRIIEIMQIKSESGKEPLTKHQRLQVSLAE